MELGNKGARSPRWVEETFTMRFMDNCKPRLLLPRQCLCEESDGHFGSEVVFQRVWIDLGRVKLLGRFYLLLINISFTYERAVTSYLEHCQMSFHQKILVRFARIWWRRESFIWSTEYNARTGNDWTIGKDHDNDTQVVLFQQVFEVVLPNVKNHLQWNFNSVITKPGNLSKSSIILQERTLCRLAIGITSDTLIPC